MELVQYLRSDFTNYIRSSFIKNKCEICQSKNNLELHHVKQFSESLQETLQLLNLDYRNDIDLYSKEELYLIRLIMLGIQTKGEYKTLCNNCHKKIKTNRYKFNICDEILKYSGVDTLMYYKCKNPKKALKILEKEYKDNKITLDELTKEWFEIGFLHPNLLKKKEGNTNKY